MRADIFKLLVSLLKDHRWRKELNRVCPLCCGIKTTDQDICWCCVNKKMSAIREDVNQDSYQGDGFSVGNSPTQISRTIHYTDKDGRHRAFQKEIA